MYAFLLLSCSAVCEILLHVVPVRERFMRMALTLAALYVLLFTTVMLVLWYGPIALVAAGINSYRVFNLLRIIKHKMHDSYLDHVTYRTSIWLIVFLYGLWGLGALLRHYHADVWNVVAALAAVQLIASMAFLRSTYRHTKRMENIEQLAPMHDKDLPAVTVAIPARNETIDLKQCLESVLASQYPKLEIIVLDDCSQSRRTPDIIRSFAHDGVRFIQGEEPKNGWLAKNQAYERLAADGSGEIILFAGVDVRFSPLAIRRLVQYMLERHKTMLSVMPVNETAGRMPLIQPMRYLWELALPRRAVKRPPVLSTCWLITRKALKASGGFQAASSMMIPESYLARQQLASDGYSFIASGQSDMVTSVKSVAEQRATATRTVYPLLHRRPETVALLSLCYSAWIVIPAAILIRGVLHPAAPYLIAAAIAVISMNVVTYGLVLRLAYGRRAIRFAANLPIATFVYVALMHYSMYKYEFSEVIWKNRNVSFPVMHVVPKLPDF